MLKLRELRFKYNVTQDELAARCGVSQATISTIERNPNYEITVKCLLSLCKVFGLTPDEYLEYDQIKKK